MANVRIDNFSGDTITVLLNKEEAVLKEGDRVSFDSLEKGIYSLQIHRTRVPLESEDIHEVKNDGGLPFKEEKSMHTQLDLLADIKINSSKTVISVKNAVTAKDELGVNAIFSSYSLSSTGAEIENERKVFASKGIKKAFKEHHIKSALFPVGLGGLAILLIGLFALVSAISATPIDIGGTEFTLPWAVGLTAVGAGFIGYSTFCIEKTLKITKEYSKKE